MILRTLIEGDSLGIGECLCSSLCLLLCLLLPPLQHGDLLLGRLPGLPLLLQASLQITDGGAVILARRYQPVEPGWGGWGRREMVMKHTHKLYLIKVNINR